MMIAENYLLIVTETCILDKYLVILISEDTPSSILLPSFGLWLPPLTFDVNNLI